MLTKSAFETWVRKLEGFFLLKLNFTSHNVESVHTNNALSRQCSEAIRIKDVKPNERINNKEEFHFLMGGMIFSMSPTDGVVIWKVKLFIFKEWSIIPTPY